MQDKDALSTLTWLLDAGADEAMGDEPVNRLVARAPVQAMTAEGSPASRVAPSRMPPLRASQTEVRPPAQASDSDAIGTAERSAAAASSLAELKAALESFEGCGLKRGATTTV